MAGDVPGENGLWISSYEVPELEIVDYDPFEIGTKHTIWVNPYMDDVLAEIVGYDRSGDAIVRTKDKQKLTLLPGEYVFVERDMLRYVENAENILREAYGEGL